MHALNAITGIWFEADIFLKLTNYESWKGTDKILDKIIIFPDEQAYNIM